VDNRSHPVWLPAGGTAVVLALGVGVPGAQAAKKRKRGPVNATVVLAPARTVSTLVTPGAGGTLKVTAPNGTKITVTIPAKAVLEDTRVTAVPVTKLAGKATSSGLLAGVQLQPEGLQLIQPATVRFAGRKPGKGKRLVFVGSQGTGKDVYRLPPPVRIRGTGRKSRYTLTGAPVVSILHFSTVEAFTWSNATTAELDAINRPAAEINRLSQEASELMRPPVRWDELNDAFERARKRLVEPALQLASKRLKDDCSVASVRYARNVATTALGFDRQSAIVGIEESSVAAVVGLIAQSADCLLKLCPASGDPRIGPYVVGYERQLAILGVGNDAYFAALEKNLLACGAFELHIDSRMDPRFEDSNYSMRVEGRVKYTPSFDVKPPPPRAPLTYLSTSGAAVSACTTTEITSTTPGEFELTEVKLGEYDPEKPATAPVVSVQLTVTVQPTEHYVTRMTPQDENCAQEPPPAYDLPFWYSNFQGEHPGGLFPGSDFLRDTAPKFALAVYSPHTIQFGNGSLSENTLVEIIHTPGEITPLPPLQPPEESGT
jgi:hypothetical protein